MAETDLRVALETQLAKWGELYHVGDFKSLAMLYTEDCKFMAPGMITQIGRQAVEEACASMKKAGFARFIEVTDEVGGMSVDGETAFERGHVSAFKEDGSSAGTGKQITIWKKVDGVYLMSCDCWNYDK